ARHPAHPRNALPSPPRPLGRAGHRRLPRSLPDRAGLPFPSRFIHAESFPCWNNWRRALQQHCVLRVSLRALCSFLTPISKCCFPGDLAPKAEEGFTLTLDTFLHVQQLRKRRLRAFCSRAGKVTALLSSRDERASLLPSLRVNTRLDLLYLLLPYRRKAMLGSYTKVLFVRDPFHRLIATFLQGMGTNPSFSSFVQEVLDSTKVHEAWKPLVSLCQPCLVQYDYVVMFGFLRQELGHLLHRAGLPAGSLLPELTDSQVQWTYRWLSEQMFSELSAQQKQQLSHFYRWDLAAFPFSSSFLADHPSTAETWQK
uniref:Carbohydrate sulfotransferase n=1 Tax=Junco hyemalis TaxID=40217 RepID=A0A8C5JA32_JUNHY